MKALVVYAHPGGDSFTRQVYKSFVKGLDDAGNAYEVSDLYDMGFQTDMTREEYLREANYRRELPLPADVMEEQRKINACDVLALIYPVFWTEAPAKLVGWFDRVWTYGFAYGENRGMKTLRRALVLCVSGHSKEKLKEYGHWQSMKTVMLGDRIHDRAEQKDMVVFDSMTKGDPAARERNWDRHLAEAYRLGREL